LSAEYSQKPQRSAGRIHMQKHRPWSNVGMRLEEIQCNFY
jgi:hypothetical protein